MPLVPGLARPDFTLTATDGQAYPFRARTAGRLTFLYFGYTSCPDVCPVQLANLSAVLHRLPYDDRQRVTVVFVTIDPARDSAGRLRAWLDQFDPAIVGLRGPLDEINHTQAALGLPVAAAGARDRNGNYIVGHTAEILVFTPDDSARIAYPLGTRQQDWAHDLPLLLHTSTARGR